MTRAVLSEVAVALMLACLASCSEGRGSTGSGGGGAGGGQGASGSGAASAGGGGAGAGGPVCVDDGVCDLPGGEECFQCSDCQVQSADCGYCFPDAVCERDNPQNTDGCTCEECAGDPGCAAGCVEDGTCDFASESCDCVDCGSLPLCSWNQ